MTLWFGSFVELEPDHGYFYLCPSCYRTYVAEHLEEVQDRLARLHPSTRALAGHAPVVAAEEEVAEEEGDEGDEGDEGGR